MTETGDELSPFEIFEIVRKNAGKENAEEDSIVSEVIEKKITLKEVKNAFEEIMMPYFESTGDEEIGDPIMQLKNKFNILKEKVKVQCKIDKFCNRKLF